ncbi:MAG: NINE protein [Bacteroidota bacterium]
MRDKNIAGVLALFLGWTGVHRFYLGQVGLGILYAILLFTGVSAVLGLIDAIVFFSMDDQAFNEKYNKSLMRKRNNSRRRTYQSESRNQRRDYRVDRWETREKRRQTNPTRTTQQRPAPTRTRRSNKPNPHKASGIKKYKDYDYDGAIVDFNKALEINDNDIAVHFNIACAYSLNEKKELAFHHLDKAVSLGFDDFTKIREHDAFAYLRIQDEFEAFEKNKFRLQEKKKEVETDTTNNNVVIETETKEKSVQIPVQDAKQEQEEEEADLLNTEDLLSQLKRLGDLRNKGLLTEEEFVTQKRRLLE